MGLLPKIYVEACPLIDMAKHKARLSLASDPISQAQRENNVWFLKKLLEAGRNKDLILYTSSLSIIECTGVEPGKPSPSQDIQDFFNMLLCSGTSGLTLVQPTQTIQIATRNLKWSSNVNLKPMDSMHVATAQHMSCSEFLTTDGRIYKSRGQLLHCKMEIIQALETKLLPHEYRQDDMEGDQFQTLK